MMDAVTRCARAWFTSAVRAQVLGILVADILVGAC